MLVFCKLANYHWKGLNDGYNFVAESASIGIHMKKVKITQIFGHVCYHGAHSWP
jgi:hypothetical protein